MSTAKEWDLQSIGKVVWHTERKVTELTERVKNLEQVLTAMMVNNEDGDAPPFGDDEWVPEAVHIDERGVCA